MKKTICILGLGYIGLPTAAMFATHGHKIIGVDINETVVKELNKGKITIKEPYLDIMVQAAVTSGNLKARTTPEKSDVFIISVPTPINENKTANMNYVKNATESIVPYLSKGNIVILESTSPPGTVENLIVPIIKEAGFDVGNDILIAHSPERVLPGRILIELVENNRIVGGINENSCKAVVALYKTFVKGEIFETNATTAEMCKLMENTFRDVNIAFANEVSMLCEKMGISVWDVINLSNKHPRVNIHQPGPGVGGHCIAVDPWFIVEKFPELSKIIPLSRNTNDSMPQHIFDKVKDNLKELNGVKNITIYGITYKNDVDDTRESPILKLIELFEDDENFNITIHDPFVQDFKYLESDPYKAVKESHMLILGVNHTIFKNMNFEHIKSNMSELNIIDTRNIWSDKNLNELGFNYSLLGKG
ncbi:MAG: nucleotide sugar dehydrogenase [Clostridiales bacterium]